MKYIYGMYISKVFVNRRQKKKTEEKLRNHQKTAEFTLLVNSLEVFDKDNWCAASNTPQSVVKWGISILFQRANTAVFLHLYQTGRDGTK